jgi:hypothetical protein
MSVKAQQIYCARCARPLFVIIHKPRRYPYLCRDCKPAHRRELVRAALAKRKARVTA